MCHNKKGVCNEHDNDNDDDDNNIIIHRTKINRRIIKRDIFRWWWIQAI